MAALPFQLSPSPFRRSSRILAPFFRVGNDLVSLGGNRALSATTSEPAD